MKKSTKKAPEKLPENPSMLPATPCLPGVEETFTALTVRGFANLETMIIAILKREFRRVDAKISVGGLGYACQIYRVSDSLPARVDITLPKSGK